MLIRNFRCTLLWLDLFLADVRTKHFSKTNFWCANACAWRFFYPCDHLELSNQFQNIPSPLQKQGAACTIFVATAPELYGIGGFYFNNCCRCEPSDMGSNPKAAADLWKITEDLIEDRLAQTSPNKTVSGEIDSDLSDGSWWCWCTWQIIRRCQYLSIFEDVSKYTNKMPYFKYVNILITLEKSLTKSNKLTCPIDKCYICCFCIL